MATLKNKVSVLVENQLPDFVRSENPNFIAFMKAYYEFMESAELKLTTLGSVDSIISESQAIGSTTLNYIILEDTNIYRPGEVDNCRSNIQGYSCCKSRRYKCRLTPLHFFSKRFSYW